MRRRSGNERERETRRDGVIEKGYLVHSLEIAYCRFERTVELPSELDEAEVRSDYRDGMLLISITPNRRDTSWSSSIPMPKPA